MITDIGSMFLAGFAIDLQAVVIGCLLFGMAGMFTYAWLMPRHLTAVLAALATAICVLIRGLL